MRMHFTEYLIREKGFKIERGLGYYSSVIPDGVATIFKKDDKIVEWGLYEKGHPPTLISPRGIFKPQIKKLSENSYIYTDVTDSQVNGWLSDKTNEEIYNELFKEC